ncbi:MAG: RICIN domain-containing protein [Porcipelethomonas sp.]
MTIRKKAASLIAALVFVFSFVLGCMPLMESRASAASVDYAAQLVRISTYDNSRNLNISGYSDKSPLNTWTTNGSQNENWEFVYVGKNSIGSFFKITNMGTGRLLTPMGYKAQQGTECVIFGSESHTSQHWYVVPVSQDARGNDLYYKIVNYDDPDMALTYNSDANNIVLSTYSGADNQKWLLNTAGLQGFGGFCKDMDGNLKASATGGLLGETVEVSTFDELKEACSGSDPRTIVITNDISCDGSYTKDSNGRYIIDSSNRIYIGQNKTIIGSYSGHQLYNVYFRTYEHENYGLGKNIIIRNITISHDKELNNDNIWEFSYGENFWIDHCTFVGHSAVNTASTGLDDWDKFLNFKGTTDYVSVTDCQFGLHEYGVLMGYPTDTQEIYDIYNGHPCITIADNYYKDCLTRAPGLMRYGYFHSFNNYVLNFDMGYTIYTASKLYAESNYYDGGTGKGSVVNDAPGQGSSGDISATYPGVYTDSGSVAVNCYKNNNLGNINSQPCSWRPSSNYSYTAKTAQEAKTYCESSSGAQSSRSAMTYAVYAAAGVPSAGYVVAPDTSMNDEPVIREGAEINTDKVFMLKNANSGLYMEVEGGTAADGTNVQQWGADGAASHNTWKAASAGDGYYYLYSQVGDKNTYLLDVTNALADNGTNIGIYSNTNSDAQLFKFVLNEDGSYTIVTKVSKDSSCIEVKDALTSSGANVQEWEINGHACQSWTIEYIEPEIMLGDSSEDGIINCFDVCVLKRGIMNGFDSDTAKLNSDVNGDGTVNAEDAVLLIDFLTGKDVTFKKYESPQKSSYEYDGFEYSGNVYLVGDSTVCEYTGALRDSCNRYGWGMKLGDNLSGTNVVNLALSGRSSRSFIEDSEYSTLCSSIGRGDYLFIQFGHNDEKTDETTYPGLGTYPGLDLSTVDDTGKTADGKYSYEWFLLNKYIKVAQDAGGIPVLVTPITRRASTGEAYYSAHTEYQQAMIKLAQDNNIPVIDMTALTTELYTNLYNAGGADATAKLHCYTDEANTTIDNTHLSEYGAEVIAGMIAEEIKKLDLSLSDYVK